MTTVDVPSTAGTRQQAATWRPRRPQLLRQLRRLASLPAWQREVEPRLTAPLRYAPLFVVAEGVFAVTASYGFARQGRDLPWLYWLGQLLVVAPVALGLLSRRTGEQHRLHLLLLLSACQSFLAWAYSPLRFTFPDELQHLRTADDILRTGHLFTPNTALPVSPGFPGLEIVTTAVSSLTGLSVTASGWIVASLAHVVLAAALLRLYQLVLGPGRAAGLAALVYAANPHGAYFNTLFLYTTLALPFMVVGLRFALAPTGHGAWRRRLLALLPMAVAVVTHHLTALSGTIILVAIGLVLLVLARRREREGPLSVVVVGVNALIIAVGWTAVAAPLTFNYLGAPLASIVTSFTGRGGTSDTVPVAATTSPRWEVGVSALSILVTLLLLALGLGLLRRARAHPLPFAFAVLGLSYGGVLGVRVLASDGAELATRSLTFVLLLVAVPAGVALARLSAGRTRLAALPALVLLLVLFAGAVTLGLPPSWERLPGTFHVAAFEAGQDQSVTAAGTWAARWTPPDSRVASDSVLGGVLGSYARADASSAASPLFYARTLDAERATTSELVLDYVFVDRRMTVQTPITGGYFPNDVQQGEHSSPLPAADLAPLDHDPLIDRVYDNGNVVGYATRRVWSS